jgi:hypothetical protein
MTRPTKEEVDEALQLAGEAATDSFDEFVIIKTLAAEVIALREESDELRDIIAELREELATRMQQMSDVMEVKDLAMIELQAMRDIKAMGDFKLKMAVTYDAEAVDALLARCDEITNDDIDPRIAVSDVLYARDAVRASREPKL